jgi:uncharacterized delta-60 repeat protein
VDGKIVAVGDSNASGAREFALARYTTTGSLDDTFNATARCYTPSPPATLRRKLSPFNRTGRSWQGDMSISYIEHRGFDFALARYNTDGTLDPTFNSTGKVVTDIGRAT